MHQEIRHNWPADVRIYEFIGFCLFVKSETSEILALNPIAPSIMHLEGCVAIGEICNTIEQTNGHGLINI